jgi:hypothetical protein
MALFVVRHQHRAERCPAQDPYGGARLLNYLSRPNVRQHGIQIHGEAVVHGEHTLYFIAEAGDPSWRTARNVRPLTNSWADPPDLRAVVPHLSHRRA